MNYNILFLAYTILDFDGRTKELIKLMDPLGNINLISFTEENDSNNLIKTKYRHKYLNVKNLFRFFISSIKKSIKMRISNKENILFIDNLYSSISGYLILRILKPEKLIIDCREYYVREQQKSWKLKVFCFFEEVLIKRADVVIVANKERADLAMNYYNLTNKPIVFENIRVLDQELQKSEMEKFDEKYKNIFNGKPTLISTGGYSLHRLTLELLAEFKTISESSNLIIVGGASENEKKQVVQYIKKHNIKNVNLIEKVLPHELKYLIGKSSIGVVIYPSHDDNNKYCASGKIYEYIDLGIPIVTSENPPLVNFVNEFRVGESNNHFSEAFKLVLENYEEYCINVNKYKKGFKPSKILFEKRNEIMKEIL